MNTHDYQDEHAGKSQRTETHLDNAALIAFEKLLDLQEAQGQPTDADLRAVRRVCGRWLMLRRVTRDLSISAVSARTGIGEGALQLLELGVVDNPQISDEAWRRLCLVLEHRANDFERVADVLRVARGVIVDSALDESFLDAIEKEAAIPEDEPAVEVQRRPESVAAPNTRSTELPKPLFEILALLLKADPNDLTTYEIKKRLQKEYQIAINLAHLPDKLARLTNNKLIERSATQRVSYRLTPSGHQLIQQAIRHREAVRKAEEAEEDWQRIAGQYQPVLKGLQ